MVTSQLAVLKRRWAALQKRDENASAYDCEVSHLMYDELIEDLLKALQVAEEKAWMYDSLLR